MKISQLLQDRDDLMRCQLGQLGGIIEIVARLWKAAPILLDAMELVGEIADGVIWSNDEEMGLDLSGANGQRWMIEKAQEIVTRFKDL